MKKLIFLLGTVALMASCKKEYTCECKTVETEDGVSTTLETKTLNSPSKMSKRNALDWCRNSEGTSTTGPGYEIKDTCELK